MTASTASRNHFSLTLQSLTNACYYVLLEILFLHLVRDAKHRAGKCNSGKRSQSCQGQRQTKKKKSPTKHPAPPSGRVPRGDPGRLLVLPKPRAGAAVGRGTGGDGPNRPRGSRAGRTGLRGRRRRPRCGAEEEEGKALPHPPGGDAGGADPSLSKAHKARPEGGPERGKWA